MKYICNVVNGIKTIKTYCWEKVFYDKVQNMRSKQLDHVWKVHLLYSFSLLLILNSGYLASLVLFGYHWGTNR